MSYISNTWGSAEICVFSKFLRQSGSLLFRNFTISINPKSLKNGLHKKKGYLVFFATSLLPMPTDRDVWPYCAVVKDSFWAVVGKQNLGAVVPHEGDGEAYQIPFEDDNEGDGIFINPQSSLRMRVDKVEVAWSDIRYESKSWSC